MRHHVLALSVLIPMLLAACGGSSDTASTGSGGGTTASGGGGSGGSGGGAGGTSSTGGSGGATGGAGGTSSTGGSGGGQSALDPTYIEDLTLPAPTSVPNNPDLTQYNDVAYGTDPKQRFDIILPASAAPTPLIINIHGGGFVGGDKAITLNGAILNTLGQGVAYASINYRLLEDVDKVGVIKPLTDSKRALQFIRYHAAELNIDPTRVALTGGSAGAGTSLWIGLHDEMAGNADPIDKMSTRVLGMVAQATQATYDLQKWETVVFAEYGLSLADAVTALGMEQRVASFYGMDSIDQFDTPPILAYRAEVDMLAHMSPDDPPVYVHNPMPATGAPQNQNELFHHGNHAKAVDAGGAAAGVDVTAVIEAFGIDESNGQTQWDFMVTQLKQ